MLAWWSESADPVRRGRLVWLNPRLRFCLYRPFASGAKVGGTKAFLLFVDTYRGICSRKSIAEAAELISC
ncbi:hypothetical protein AB833_09020 [Chromatiales bacterium (ex Bugula neritina AB1)]|nr:hypothetical protein AB833_09020 [Chromatiales bacterium (ex Bugula neritina AB1)]